MSDRAECAVDGVFVDLTRAELEEVQRAICLREHELREILRRSRAEANRPRYTVPTRRAAAVARMILRTANEKLEQAEFDTVRSRRQREAAPVDISPDPFPLVPYRSPEWTGAFGC
jgi:hypothetical protein